MKCVGVYVRVSTASQNEAGQRREISRWLAGNGINAAQVRWYVDKLTGDNLNRPAFERLQGDVFRGEVGTIVVYKLDRLSRKMRDGINVLCDWCERGVRVVSVTQQIDLSGTVGRMIAAVLLAVGELEQEGRRERQQAGIAAAKERGVYQGRKAGTTKGKPDRAKKLAERGLTHKEIAMALGVSRRSVIRYLQG